MMSEVSQECNSARQYDLVLLPEGVVATVLGKNLGKLVVHPKYVKNRLCTQWEFLDSYWTRISNPFDAARTNKYDVSACLERFGSQDYYCHRYEKLLAASTHMQKSTNPHLRLTHDLIGQVRDHLEYASVGITGGALLGFGKKGFSDIDLVIENFAYPKFAINLPNIPGVRHRSLDEWMLFYKAYNVQANLSAREFAQQMLRKSSQFLYHNVPVSVFIRAELPELPLLADTSQQTISGITLDDSRSALLPAEYTIGTDTGPVNLVSHNRAFTEYARIGEYVQATGIYTGRNRSLIIREGTVDRMEIRK